ncbi:DUF3800 domain-containing protein [Enterobacter hormaechei]|uniref:DUF3800 domain-containing protein n=1 Tax=Enterobacter hormaechei TaxID=158836 RepID=UPI0039C247E0|nr:DUF3800 domain-containing protein [Enterobacter hormaechei]HBM2774097.1 DUF3800 domain-containing protein [Enterobacter hormaechei subsp. xiangfangensis]
MEILIDESGSFTPESELENSWSVVAAYICPETEKRKYRNALNNLKKRNGLGRQEIKLVNISESNYILFLQEISQLNGSLFCVVTDSYYNNKTFIENHKDTHVKTIVNSIEQMRYHEGKLAQHLMAKELLSVSLPLYIQLMCQIRLVHTIISQSVNYYAQRQPQTLKKFKWRLDQKQPSHKTKYELIFEKFSPALLQMYTLENPLGIVNGFNYKYMREFIYNEGEIPNYLIEKKTSLANSRAFNIQKILRDDISYEDSMKNDGLQVIDLLASGMRKLLKMRFADNTLIANLLGSLMIQQQYNNPPIDIIVFDEKSAALRKELDELVKILIKNSKRMIR